MMPTYFGEQRKKEICRLLGQRYRLFLLLGIILILSSSSSAQVETATVSGVITDQSGGVVVGAEVRVTNVDTNVTSTTTSNRSGVYLVTGLKPGRYRIKVKKEGFKGIDLTDLVLNVQASINRNFALELGSVSESISVEGGVSLVNTTDASVGTVVDRKYVENMPLNGRSFQDLILLTPGIVTNTPQLGPAGAPGVGTRGEFNVNGQRTESNYYMVDGASANVGIVPGGTTFSATSGSLPGSTALGTTQALVSVDALEEFRVQTSTYSAEYGRNPGAQFSFVTRSGTNQWHGTAFDYLRNDYFDANNWFNNFFGKREPPLRQNDFGGTLGGPVKLPKLYSERDKTFFFFSYEGLRVLLPQAATLNYVPDTGLRQSARAPLQAVMNAFPRQNGPEALDSMGNPTGMAEFIAAWSNPSSLDAYSIRLDHNFGDRLRLFFRFSDTPSSGNSRLTGGGGTPSVVQTFKFTPRTYTLGATSVFSSRLNNEFRFNYSSNLAEVLDTLDNFGGAQPINLAQLQQIAPSSYEVDAGLVGFSGFTAQLTQKQVSGLQRQWNVTDSLSLLLGRHQLKFGIDYRRIAPVQKPGLVAGYNFFSQNDVQTNNPGFVLASNQVSAYPLYTNFSAFAQDEWRVTPKLSITMGLRWEVNPAPGVTQGILPRPVVGNSLATLMLAPQGTPLWKTGWYNFAPRLGAAYILRGVPGWETVMRGGAGLFFDTGQQLGSMGYAGPGFANNAAFGYASPSGVPVSFPIPPAQIPPPTSIPTPPYNATGFAFPTHYQFKVARSKPSQYSSRQSEFS